LQAKAIVEPLQLLKKQICPIEIVKASGLDNEMKQAKSAKRIREASHAGSWYTDQGTSFRVPLRSSSSFLQDASFFFFLLGQEESCSSSHPRPAVRTNRGGPCRAA
jgi:hypothetical protein